MREFKKPSLVAGVGLVVLATASCKSRHLSEGGDALVRESVTSRSVDTIPGIPFALALGERSFGSAGSKAIFYNDARVETASFEVQGTSLFIAPSGEKINFKNQATGVYYTDEMPCKDALALFWKGTAKQATQVKCRLQYSGTGPASAGSSNQGIFVSIFPVDDAGLGYVGKNRAASGTTFTARPGRLPDDGIPLEPNSPLDVSGAAEAFRVVFKDLMQESFVEAEINGCLLNPRSGGWSDLAAHYYCFLPYSTMRVCYSGALAKARAAAAPGAAFDVNTVAANAADLRSRVDANLAAHKSAFNACFAKRAPHADWFERDSQRGSWFKRIVWTLPGHADYEVSAQTKAIATFYELAKFPRPRRTFDAFPEFVDPQPRLDALRALQAKHLEMIED